MLSFRGLEYSFSLEPEAGHLSEGALLLVAVRDGCNFKDEKPRMIS